MGFPLPQPTLDFNPLFPHGKRPGANAGAGLYLAISTPSSRTGRDSGIQKPQTFHKISTPSSRTGRDHVEFGRPLFHHDFNPLFPHGKRPGGNRGLTLQLGNFNPLFPHGKRPRSSMATPSGYRFQPPLPAREETIPAVLLGQQQDISTPSSRTGRDPSSRIKS